MRSAGIRRRRWQPERGSHLSSGWPLQWRWPSRRSNRWPARQSVRANRLSRLRRGKSSTGLYTGTCTEASVGDPHNERWRAHVPRFVAGRPPPLRLPDRTRWRKVGSRSVVRTNYAARPTREVAMRIHPVVSQNEWLDARARLLAKEKAFTRQRDQLSEQRRALPWVKVQKEYVFDGPNGRETLAQLFQGRSQLLIYHFMYGTDWNEGCKNCSFWADSFNGITAHLKHRDVTMIAVSRAPYSKLKTFQQRMGWSFKWVS